MRESQFIAMPYERCESCDPMSDSNPIAVIRRLIRSLRFNLSVKFEFKFPFCFISRRIYKTLIKFYHITKEDDENDKFNVFFYAYFLKFAHFISRLKPNYIYIDI